jgi:hypothetical protein
MLVLVYQTLENTVVFIIEDIITGGGSRQDV